MDLREVAPPPFALSFSVRSTRFLCYFRCAFSSTSLVFFEFAPSPNAPVFSPLF